MLCYDEVKWNEVALTGSNQNDIIFSAVDTRFFKVRGQFEIFHIELYV